MGRILYLDGFEAYDTPHILDRWDMQTSVSAAATPFTLGVVGREGNGITSGTPGAYLKKNLPSNHTDIVFGAAVRFNSYPFGSTIQAVGGFALTGSDVSVGLGIDSVGALHAYSGTTNGTPTTDLGASPNATITTGKFYYLEMRANFSAKTLIVRVNELVVLNLTAVNFPTTGANQIVLHTNSDATGPWAVDDLYVLDPTDTSDVAPATFLGDIAIPYYTATANGRKHDFTPVPSTDANYQAVSDNPPDDDTSYVQASIVGTSDSYKVTIPTTNPAPIIAAQVIALVRKDTTGSRSIALGIGNGVAESYGGSHTLLQSYSYATEIFTKNPITGVAFANSDLAALEIAVEISA